MCLQVTDNVISTQLHGILKQDLQNTHKHIGIPITQHQRKSERCLFSSRVTNYLISNFTIKAHVVQKKAKHKTIPCNSRERTKDILETIRLFQSTQKYVLATKAYTQCLMPRIRELRIQVFPVSLSILGLVFANSENHFSDVLLVRLTFSLTYYSHQESKCM